MADSNARAAFVHKAWAALELLADGTSFCVTGIEFAEGATIDPVADKAPAVVEKRVRLLKSKEERYVLGVVLEPTLELNKPDSQNDVYSAEDVRQAAYNFMENYQTIGIQHTKAAGDKIKILESWIQRDDTVIDGQEVAAGTWLLGVRIVDDDLWEAVKDGSFTGFSIGGIAQRAPLEA